MKYLSPIKTWCQNWKTALQKRNRVVTAVQQRKALQKQKSPNERKTELQKLKGPDAEVEEILSPRRKKRETTGTTCE